MPARNGRAAIVPKPASAMNIVATIARTAVADNADQSSIALRRENRTNKITT
jgi:hypothetical protein